MRFALRNKSRLIESFGDSYYKQLVNSLTKYSNENSTIARYKLDGYTHDFISVPKISENTGYFQFAIVGEQFDVLRLAYFHK